MQVRQASLVLVLGLSGFLAGVFGQASLADTVFGDYIRSAPVSGPDKDPVNVLYTINGSLANTLAHFAHHVGWYDDGGSDMWFRDSCCWYIQDAQKASWCGWCERNHTRFKHHQTYGDPGYQDFTMGAAHYEIVVGCGHSSRSFNAPRDAIASAFQGGGHLAVWYYRGNNAASVQCDQVYTAGDGWLIRAEIP
jgi:hypothetical protein